MKNKYISLFANCLPVKGARRSVICDLQRNHYIFVPNYLADLFLQNSAVNRLELESKLSGGEIQAHREYIKLLEGHDMIFHSTKTELAHFPKLSMEWDFPSHATNAIIDIKSDSRINFHNLILEQLDEINCRFVQFRAFTPISEALWLELAQLISKSELKSVEFIVKDDSKTKTHQKIIGIINRNRKIKSVILHSSRKDELLHKESEQGGNLVAVIQEINDATHCGNVHHSYFSVNIETFTESQHYNSCLNRKISIDIDGNIKNCPSMQESYGNITNTTLRDVVDKSGFKKYWNITKDQISVCKDCEFRHVCTDCRAYLENPEDEYSKPLKCGYNPYTCEWEPWSNHPMKQKAIDHYGMRSINKTQNQS